MLKKLAGIATAMAMAMAIAVLATLVEASSTRATVPRPATADLLAGRGGVRATDMETRTVAIGTVAGEDFASRAGGGVQDF
jgi:hypothetical protein